MNVAYIAYTLYQNEPSRPEPLTLEPGKLRAQLLALYKKELGIKPKKLSLRECDGYCGDVRVESPSDDSTMIFISFSKEDRAAAFKELGLDIKKLQV